MSDLTIYGTYASRATRNIWMALELGIDYSLESVDTRKGEQKGDDYLAVNPNARVPALRDGDLVLWESLAINLYLAKKYGGELAPLSLEDEARAIQWSMWALTEAESHCVVIIQNLMGHAGITDEMLETAHADVARPLKVLEGALQGRDHLLGAEFTVADLNVASVLGTLQRAKYDLGPYPKVAAWLTRCTARSK